MAPRVERWLNLRGAGTLIDPFKMDLPGDSLKRLFEPVDPAGDISKGGLGLQPERFFLGSFKPKLMGDGGQQFPYSKSNIEGWAGRRTASGRRGPTGRHGSSVSRARRA